MFLLSKERRETAETRLRVLLEGPFNAVESGGEGKTREGVELPLGFLASFGCRVRKSLTYS